LLGKFEETSAPFCSIATSLRSGKRLDARRHLMLAIPGKNRTSSYSKGANHLSRFQCRAASEMLYAQMDQDRETFRLSEAEHLLSGHFYLQAGVCVWLG
jgi:hypothetical protein